ncbi:MAG: PQQ-dependent sugar dehydrogenase [Pirellulales bacterium]
MRIAWLFLLFAVLVSVPAGAAGDDAAPFGIEKRTTWTNSRLVGSPEPPLPYTVEKTFEKLDLKTPIYVVEEPLTDCLLVILHAEGKNPSRIVRFKNDPAADTFEPFFESPNRLIYSICFDADYATNRRLYVFTNGPTPETQRKDRLSRYRVEDGPPRRIDPKSEEIIVEWRSAGHDGGDMAFGLDGMLYLTTGDGTGDSDTWNSGQTLDDLLGAVLRIDVRQAEGDRPYRVPPDNPFVNLPDARGEIWAYGLRNPWRMCVDPKTGHVWVGTNGQDLWETAHLVRRGDNYGWSVYEGSHPFYPERKRGPTPLTAPTIEHSHAEFRSLTGGVVYYGGLLPELEGAYIYGDYSSGRIWGMKHDGQRVIWHRELADTRLMIAAFRVIPEGQMIVADHGGGLYRLVPAEPPQPRAPFPMLLSETGLFASTAEHQPAAGLVPYSVNAPAWADGAVAERFIAVPGEAKVEYNSNQSWNFSDGAALVQTLSLERESGNPASRFRVETRVLVRQQGEWAGYSYRWDDAQSDAELVSKNGATADFAVRDPTSSGTRRQTWRFPSRAECMACHSRAANFVLGLSEAQLNRDHDYPAARDNQLRTLEHIGLFSGELPKRPAELSKLVDPYDAAQDAEARARSYLHVNCAVCHMAAGGGNSKMELARATEREKMVLVEARPQHDTFGIVNAMLVAPGDPERSVLVHRLSRRGRGQMPPLVSTRVDDRAVELVRGWIAAMKPTRPIVRDWQTADLLPALDQLKTGRSLDAGKTAFRETGCVQCHRCEDEGGTVGPDLTDAAKRFSANEMLEAVLEPSKKIADEYATWLVQTADGRVVSGRIERESDGVLVLGQASSAEPPVEIEKSTIVGRRKSETSNMPVGIVNVLHKEELLDLLAYLISSRKPQPAN